MIKDAPYINHYSNSNKIENILICNFKLQIKMSTSFDYLETVEQICEKVKMVKTFKTTSKPVVIFIGHTIADLKQLKIMVKKDGYSGQIFYYKSNRVEFDYQKLLIEFVNNHRIMPKYCQHIPVNIVDNSEGYLFVIIGKKIETPPIPAEKPKKIDNPLTSSTVTATTIKNKKSTTNVNFKKLEELRAQKEWAQSQTGKEFISQMHPATCLL